MSAELPSAIETARLVLRLRSFDDLGDVLSVWYAVLGAEWRA